MQLVEEIIDAVRSDESNRALRTLASKLAEVADEMDPVEANDTIWKVVTDVGEDVDDKKFWITLGKSAENAADQVEEPRTLGNIQDTAAHCYHFAGDIELAIELQTSAVENSADANDGEPNEQLSDFLDELQELAGESRR